jgi:hypothetical protein
MSLAQSIDNLIEGLSGHLTGEAIDEVAKLIRLNVLQGHIDAGRLTQDLDWIR